MSTITTSGIVRDKRVHVRTGADWARMAATDFWIVGGASEESSATGAGLRTLDGGGWTATNITEYVGGAGGTGDFLSATGDDPSAFHLDAQNDLIQSPALFGSYAHAYMASNILGYTVTELNVEVYSQFVDATNDEEHSQLGFVEGGGSIIVAADAMACVYSDGTNYRLRSGAAETAVCAAVDTAWHLWRIKVVAAGCSLYMDGTLQNATVLALQTNTWPVHFGIGVGGAANFQKLTWGHVWYA